MENWHKAISTFVSRDIQFIGFIINNANDLPGAIEFPVEALIRTSRSEVKRVNIDHIADPIIRMRRLMLVCLMSLFILRSLDCFAQSFVYRACASNYAVGIFNLSISQFIWISRFYPYFGVKFIVCKKRVISRSNCACDYLGQTQQLTAITPSCSVYY